MTTTNEAFEAWWKAEGQFCRAGGGDYEKTFAFRAFEFATERAAKLVEGEAVEELTDGDLAYNMATRHCAAAIRAGGEQT